MLGTRIGILLRTEMMHHRSDQQIIPILAVKAVSSTLQYAVASTAIYFRLSGHKFDEYTLQCQFRTNNIGKDQNRNPMENI